MGEEVVDNARVSSVTASEPSVSGRAPVASVADVPINVSALQPSAAELALGFPTPVLAEMEIPGLGDAAADDVRVSLFAGRGLLDFSGAVPSARPAPMAEGEL